MMFFLISSYSQILIAGRASTWVEPLGLKEAMLVTRIELA
jgi:hypothetical protein